MKQFLFITNRAKVLGGFVRMDLSKLVSDMPFVWMVCRFRLGSGSTPYNRRLFSRYDRSSPKNKRLGGLFGGRRKS